MASYCYVFFYTCDDFTLVPRGKVSYKKILKTFKKNNDQMTPLKDIEKEIVAGGKQIKMRPIKMMTCIDPLEKKVARKGNFTEITFKDDTNVVVDIPYGEFYEQYNLSDERLLFESRFVEYNFTLVRKNTIKEFKKLEKNRHEAEERIHD